MFGLGLSQILLIAVLIALLWRGTAMLKALQTQLNKLQRADEEAEAKRPSHGRIGKPDEPVSVELQPCPHCGDFVPKGSFCGGPEVCERRKG